MLKKLSITIISYSLFCLAFSCDFVKSKKSGGDNAAAEKKADIPTEPAENPPVAVDPKGKPLTPTGPVDGSKPKSPESFKGMLHTLNSCEVVKEAVEERIIDILKFQAEDAKERFSAFKKHNQRFSPPRVGGGNGPGVDSVMNDNIAESAERNTPDISTADSSTPKDVSGTNLQVEGVDEADIVKTTGELTYIVSRNRLNIIKSWPANKMEKLASIPFFDQHVRDMFLTEDKKLIIIGSKVTGRIRVFGYEKALSLVTVLDVTDPASPKELESFVLPGTYNSTRRIGDSLRIVLNDWYNYDYLYQKMWQVMHLMYSMEMTEKEFNDRIDAELAQNIEAVKKNDLNELLAIGKYIHIKDGKENVINDATKCPATYIPDAQVGLGKTSIVTINMKNSSLNATLLLAHTKEVYASTKSLYLTTPHYWFRQAADQEDHTYIHRFDITDPTKVDYLGTGKIPGMVLNQYSMDEFEDKLRIATTVTVREAIEVTNPTPFWWRPFRTVTQNRVSVLGLKDGVLEIMGQTEVMAENERIFSVRFDKKRGFVVTFRRIDPLFTLNLEDPKNPQIVGELKVDGVSNYIHMLDKNHLLTVGESGSWGLRVSIFDVTDMANPTQKYKHDLPRQSSVAQYDFKAFTLLKSKGILAIPVAGYVADPSSASKWWQRYRSTLMVFRVSPEDGIKAVGELDMGDIYQEEKDLGWSNWRRYCNVNRSIIADEFIYAISDVGVRSASINDLSKPLSTIHFSLK